MKKLLWVLSLFHFVLNAQESRTTLLKVEKQFQHTYISDILKVENVANNPFVAFSIRVSGNSINNAIETVYYKDFENNWQLFPVGENNFEVDNWHGLAYLDVASKQTQVKIVFNKPVLMDNIKFNFYYPYKTEFLKREAEKKTANIDKVETKTLASCNCASPTVTTRSTWCPTNNCPPNSNPTSTDVKFLIVHHTAGANSSSDWAAVVRSIWNYHVNTNGWSDIGYNFLLDKTGNVYEGREDDTMGAHFSGRNSGTSGISLMGTYNTVTPTTVMIDSLKSLLAWKACVKNIDPTATAYHASSGLNLKTISGHRDGPNATECPGHKVYDMLPAIRTGVKDLIDNCAVLGVDDEFLRNFKIYPNPFFDKIFIENTLFEDEILKIKCFDVTGRLVFEHDEALNNSKAEVDLSFLSPGMYWLELKIDTKKTHFKLIKT
ncbi:N-acetylmuramoyl-L-alanine amidase [Aureibaculum sp. 2210JD6-5]|uniref:N-acetylmuramoyl-L-alanine amidase n=1 Tax=Aureibaculum sp. 2210JD6-5 TaxID=3103957 RepID=UPI002AAD4A1C|nr:N-acetylmuramoyl-L-alanine amidase [Aureibaculum sp. 2210JD6-5]MDY7393905.1 N-acetylmuramoyl-L-alanine amidase [Aureibaculum sp. 2210JD6-5]